MSHSLANRLPRSSRAAMKPTRTAPRRLSTWLMTTSQPLPSRSRQGSVGHSWAGASARRPAALSSVSGAGGAASPASPAEVPAPRVRLAPRAGGAGVGCRCGCSSSSLPLALCSSQSLSAVSSDGSVAAARVAAALRLLRAAWKLWAASSISARGMALVRTYETSAVLASSTRLA